VAWIRQENPGRVERYGKEMVEEQDGICGESKLLTLELEKTVVEGKQLRLRNRKAM